MLTENFFMCFVDLGKAFDRIPKKVLEWALKKEEKTRSFG